MSPPVAKDEAHGHDKMEKSISDKGEELAKYFCANVRADSPTLIPCSAKGDKYCKKCGLVGYCSRECQLEHWPAHKVICNSPLAKASWQPAYQAELRIPNFSTPGGLRIRYLFGNTPAADLLNLKGNEGLRYNDDINLCYAASGDPRNIMTTILALPDSYGGKCTVVVNDIEPFVSLRNTVIFLMASELDPGEAVDAIVHVWYSASIDDKTRNTLMKIQAFIKAKLSILDSPGLKDRSTASIKFGKHLVALVVFQWRWVIELLNGIEKYSNAKAQTQRKRFFAVGSGKDALDRLYSNMEPYQRVSHSHYLEAGVLIPLAVSAVPYVHANPLLVGSGPDYEWLPQFSASPLSGWAIEDILSSGKLHGIPKDDIYGAAYHHVRDVVSGFCKKLANLDVSFEIYQCQASYLCQHMALDGRHPSVYRFDRIDLSNITDIDHSGSEIVASFAPYLRTMAQNPHATILSLYMRPLDDFESLLPRTSKAANGEAVKNALQLVPYTGHELRDSLYSAHTYKLTEALSWFKDNEALYKDVHTKVLIPTGNSCGLTVKETNTIMKRWPFAFRDPNDLESQKKQLRAWTRVGVRGYALYVEWKLTRDLELPDYQKELAARNLEVSTG